MKAVHVTLSIPGDAEVLRDGHDFSRADLRVVLTEVVQRIAAELDEPRADGLLAMALDRCHGAADGAWRQAMTADRPLTCMDRQAIHEQAACAGRFERLLHYLGAEPGWSSRDVDREIIPTTERTAEDLLKSVLRALPRVVSYPHAGIRWSAVGAATGLGSTSATELCRWAGLDPHEQVGPTQWEAFEDAFGDEVTDEQWEAQGWDPWPKDKPRYRRDPECGREV